MYYKYKARDSQGVIWLPLDLGENLRFLNLVFENGEIKTISKLLWFGLPQLA